MTEESSEASRIRSNLTFYKHLMVYSWVYRNPPPDLPGGVVRLLNPGFFDKYVTGGPHGAGAALVTVFQQYAVGA